MNRIHFVFHCEGGKEIELRYTRAEVLRVGVKEMVATWTRKLSLPTCERHEGLIIKGCRIKRS